MSSGGHNRKNLSTARFKRIDSFSLNQDYQASHAVILRINDTPHTVLLSKTPNNYGGRNRIYFICPCCHTRIRMLYVTEKVLFCRNCVRLSYPSQRCGNISKVFHQLTPLFRKLKANLDSEYMIRYLPPRPRYMRYTTYQKLIKQINELQNQHWNRFIDWTQKFFNNRQEYIKRKD